MKSFAEYLNEAEEKNQDIDSKNQDTETLDEGPLSGQRVTIKKSFYTSPQFVSDTFKLRDSDPKRIEPGSYKFDSFDKASGKWAFRSIKNSKDWFLISPKAYKDAESKGLIH